MRTAGLALAAWLLAGSVAAQPARPAVTASAEDCAMLEAAFRAYLPVQRNHVALPLRTHLTGADFNDPPLPTDPAALERERAQTAAYLGRAFPELSAPQLRDLAVGHERPAPGTYTLACRWRLQFLPPREPDSAPFPNLEWRPPIRSRSGALAVAPMSWFLSPTMSRSGACLFEHRAGTWRLRRCATIVLS